MKVSVIMGSISDLDQGEKVFSVLEKFGIEYEKRVISAHRALSELLNYIDDMEDIGVIIALAGKAAHLGGVIAGHTTLPVIGVPIKSSFMDGLDSLLSMVQMPSGVPVATVGVNGGENAAILAAQILSLSDKELARKLKDYKVEMYNKVMSQDELLNREA